MKFGEWPLALCKKRRIKIPSIDQLREALPVGGNSIMGAAMVLVPCNNSLKSDEFISEVLDWFVENEVDAARFRIYGIHGYSVKRYTTERMFKGLSVYFYQHIDAVNLKLCMADRCFSDHSEQLRTRMQ